MRTITSGKTRISAIDGPESALSNINMHNVICMGTQTSKFQTQMPLFFILCPLPPLVPPVPFYELSSAF